MPTMPILPVRLGVLDLCTLRSGGTAGDALREAVELARACDSLGYHRFWLAEHHNTPAFACAAPEAALGTIAASTSRIRVGTGGVLLGHYSALKVAETFRLLEALHPGRIDLGIGRNPGGEPHVVTALHADAGSFDQASFFSELQLLELFLTDRFEPADPGQEIFAAPSLPRRPEIWILGSGVQSVAFACQLGHPFCAAHFLQATNSPRALRYYRERYEPSAAAPDPRAALAVSVVVADSEEEARRLATASDIWAVRMQQGRPVPVPSMDEALRHVYTQGDLAQMENARARRFAGTPEQVRSGLRALAAECGADELMVLTNAPDFASRRRSYELLAEAFELAPSGSRLAASPA